MNLPRWKIWLSYLFEMHIESASSSYNPHLYVSLYKGRYQLSTANAVYSFGDLYTNFSRTFQRFNWEEKQIKEVLLLGLGLGSIPVILEQVHKKIFNYTAVEIDEEVIDLAYRYAINTLESPVNMITADAAIAVQQFPDQQYDLICIDLFDDDIVPETFETEAFLHQIQRLLAPNGIVLFNRLAAKTQDIEKSTFFFNTTFKTIFPKGEMIDVGGNFMLVNDAALFS